MTDSSLAAFGFDSVFLQKLERLTLLNRRPLQGPSAGPRRSPRHGASVEFADFRNYATGDDFRRVDWNAYARLDRLFLRLYRAEEMTTLTLFVDHSTSMRFGTPSKALTAGRLAAIFSYIALHNYDAVAVAGWGDRIDRYLPVQTTKSAVPQVWRTIAEVMESPAGVTDFGALRQHGRYRTGPGLAIVLSDFLTDSDWRGGLRALRAGGQEVTAIQVLAPEEINPSLRGDWKLVDAETGAETEVTISPRLLRRYEEELAAHSLAIRDYCRRQGIAFMQLSSDIDIANLVLTDLRALGVLQ
jgi:uncharacterized protein (DUF58 family)